MKFFKSFSIFLFILLCCNAFSSEGINDESEFFGYKFGENINSTSEGIFECSENKITCWGTNRDITPATYNVQIGINKDGSIFALTARQSFGGANGRRECLFMAGRLVNDFNKKYGVQFIKTEEHGAHRARDVWTDINMKLSIVKVSIFCTKNSLPGLKEPAYMMEIYLSNSNYEKF